MFKIPEPMRRVQLKRTYAALPDQVFAAWTQPELLKKWWGVAEGYTVPIAEVDLRVGGRYRLGMLAPNDAKIVVLTGEYRVIEPPDRLVFTWRFENETPDAASLITLQFIKQGQETELVLTHEYQGSEELARNFRQGWEGMFVRLEQALLE